MIKGLGFRFWGFGFHVKAFALQRDAGIRLGIQTDF